MDWNRYGDEITDDDADPATAAVETGEPVAPKRVCPVTPEDLSEYVDGLNQLTKRKRELRPAIEAAESRLQDIVAKIDHAEKFPAALKATIDGFPQELLTAEIVQVKERLASLMRLELEKWAVTARHMRDDVGDECSRLTSYLVDMNRAGANAGQEPIHKNMCPVCMTNEIVLACDPCGHTFCDKCCKECTAFRPVCPMCRTPVKKRMRVYISM